MRYKKKFETRSYELDRHDALNPTTLVQYLQETAEQQIRDQDVDYTVLYHERRKAFVVSRMGIEIYAPIAKYAKVEGQTWIVPGRAANFPRAYELYHGSTLVARSYSNWALIDVDTKRLIRFHDYDTSNYATDEEPALQIPMRFRIPKDVPLQCVATQRVKRTLTDINGHMNNAMYFNCLYDEIPGMEDCILTSINIRFVHEAPRDAEMAIWRSDFCEPGDVDPRADEIMYFRTRIGDEVNVEAVFGRRRLR